MHAFDETTEELARLIVAYASRRIANPAAARRPGARGRARAAGRADDHTGGHRGR